MSDFYEMSVEDRADCIADAWTVGHVSALRNSARWRVIRDAALRHINEALEQDRTERRAA